MLAQSAVNVGNFIYCGIYQGPNETVSYLNASDNDGHFHRFVYVIDGELDAYNSVTEVPSSNTDMLRIIKDNMYNMDHTKDKWIITKTQDTGAAMLMFNPIPASELLDVQIIKGPTTVVVDGFSTIVCMTGPVVVNDKELDSMFFAKVAEGMKATVVLKDKNIIALVR